LVIAGIYETEDDRTEQGIPWLMKVPFLQWLFKNQELDHYKRELLIFLTPGIIQHKAGI
jgi:type IV pilus assembly protein PilQ